jgi:hypothetical protein
MKNVYAVTAGFHAVCVWVQAFFLATAITNREPFWAAWSMFFILWSLVWGTHFLGKAREESK